MSSILRPRDRITWKLETDFEHDIREDLDMFRKRYLETIAEDPEPPVWKALDQFEMTFSQ